MTTDKKNLQDEELKKDDNVSDTETESVIERGQEAIKASQIADPNSAEEQRKDAEEWRNEG